ncbi:MAG: D-sedoheptulose 7-phosphate isomerase [Limisphaerales bacterium]
MTTQNFEMALAHVAASLDEGAKLRMKVASDCGPAIVEAAALVAGCLRSGGKILLCGNGGSAADAQHLAAEFVGRFILDRPALPAVALTTDSSILTAVGNDYGFEQIFSRQIQALGRPGDVAIGISTSGHSPNIIAAMREARNKGLKSIGLAGKDGGALAKHVDVPIIIASQNTARIQECHITVGHLICELVEKDLSPHKP